VTRISIRNATYDVSNILRRKYIYGPSVDEPICMIEAAGSYAGTYYYHFDALGSVVGLTNSSGNTVEVYEYDVYGRLGATDASHPNRILFTGREYDKETGLYYYRARYYNPQIGRFLQTDPVGYGAGMNLYQYCGNGPIGRVDPFGLSYSSMIAAGCTVAGFAWNGHAWYVLYNAPGMEQGHDWNLDGVANAVLATHPDTISVTTDPCRPPIYSSDPCKIRPYNDLKNIQQGAFEQLTSVEVRALGLTPPPTRTGGEGHYAPYDGTVDRDYLDNYALTPAGMAGFVFTRQMLAGALRIATGRDIDEVDRLVKDYGGTAKGWRKMKGWDAQGREWHWYEHTGIGRR
jgi:RHS repeat-associated protein